MKDLALSGLSRPHYRLPYQDQQRAVTKRRANVAEGCCVCSPRAPRRSRCVSKRRGTTPLVTASNCKQIAYPLERVARIGHPPWWTSSLAEEPYVIDLQSAYLSRRVVRCSHVGLGKLSDTRQPSHPSVMCSCVCESTPMRKSQIGHFVRSLGALTVLCGTAPNGSMGSHGTRNSHKTYPTAKCALSNDTLGLLASSTRGLCHVAVRAHSRYTVAPAMSQEIKNGVRRYVRALGPFSGYHLGLRKTPVLVFNLNLGGGFVNFTGEQPASSTFVLTIDLQQQGRITVKAETVYRDPSGIAVRFVDLDADTCDRLGRGVERVRQQQTGGV